MSSFETGETGRAVTAVSLKTTEDRDTCAKHGKGLWKTRMRIRGRDGPCFAASSTWLSRAWRVDEEDNERFGAFVSEELYRTTESSELPGLPRRSLGLKRATMMPAILSGDSE